MKLGRTSAGRYLQVIYSPDEELGERLRYHCLRTDWQRQKADPRRRQQQREAAIRSERLPPGWGDSRIREVLDHYDAQDDDERAAEIEAAWEADGMTLMSVPTELVPEIHERVLLAQADRLTWGRGGPATRRVLVVRTALFSGRYAEH